MAKAKIARKSTWVDMTPFVDIAFLLLTFFMLVTKFKPSEAVPVDTPTSTSQIALPDKYIKMTVDKYGRIFFSLDGKTARGLALDKIGAKYKISFSPEEKTSFINLEQFGVPVQDLKKFLDMTSDQQKDYAMDTTHRGIPVDTSASGDNQLYQWLKEARLASPDDRIAIKGDRNSHVPVFNKIIKTMQDQDALRFNLITGAESENQN
jgi:biopolymer transport protein ExbD